MPQMCTHCKWGIITKFKPEYAGRVIGCTKPEEQWHRGVHCFEEKEDADEQHITNP